MKRGSIALFIFAFIFMSTIAVGFSHVASAVMTVDELNALLASDASDEALRCGAGAMFGETCGEGSVGEPGKDDMIGDAGQMKNGDETPEQCKPCPNKPCKFTEACCSPSDCTSKICEGNRCGGVVSDLSGNAEDQGGPVFKAVNAVKSGVQKAFAALQNFFSGLLGKFA